MRFPGDKSLAHRALLLAALARTPSRIGNLPEGDDVQRTVAAVAALGAVVAVAPGTAGATPPAPFTPTAPLVTPTAPRVTPTAPRVRGPSAPVALVTPAAAPITRVTPGAAAPITIDCGNSGTLARLLLGLCAGSDAPLDVTLVGDASLSRRPMARVARPLAKLALADITLAGDTLPARVVTEGTRTARTSEATGRTEEVDTEVPSAQVKSALILAARGLEDVVIREATPTRDHTERMIAWLLARPGASGSLRTVSAAGGVEVHLHGPLAWDGFDVELPGDPSSAALVAAYAVAAGRAFTASDVVTNARRAGFWRALARMGVDVRVLATGERMGEPVGDVVIGPRARDDEGARVHEAHARVPTLALEATTVGPGELPDLVDEVPALVVVALHASGTTRIEGAGELRVKESDRLALLVELARSFRGRAEIDGDALVVHGPRAHLCASDRVHVRTDGDHRIAMAAQILARLDGVHPIFDVDDAARTSFPGFEAALDSLDQQTNQP